jgi:DNA-directed RNA polymerase specialized sigma24 family protein
MPETKQITRPMPYASSDDFRRVFDEDMNSLYLLSYLLTTDREKAEQCFVAGLEDAVEGNPVFKEWAHSWARRVIIVNAVRAINPRPLGENARSSAAPVSGNGKTPSVEQVEIAAVLALEPFERFVYVMTVLERYSDQDCSLLLGCARREVVAARTRAFEQIGSAMASYSAQLPPASSEKAASPVPDERRGSLLDLLVGQRLATST